MSRNLWSAGAGLALFMALHSGGAESDGNAGAGRDRARIDLLRSLIAVDPLIAEGLPFEQAEIAGLRPKTDLGWIKSRYEELADMYHFLLLKPEYRRPGTLVGATTPMISATGLGDDCLYCEYETADWLVRIRDSRFFAVYLQPRSASVVEWWSPESSYGDLARHMTALTRRFSGKEFALYRTALLSSKLGSVWRFEFAIYPAHTPGYLYTDGFFVCFVLLKGPSSHLVASASEEQGRQVGEDELWEKMRVTPHKFTADVKFGPSTWRVSRRKEPDVPQRLLDVQHEPPGAVDLSAGVARSHDDADNKKEANAVGAGSPQPETTDHKPQRNDMPPHSVGIRPSLAMVMLLSVACALPVGVFGGAVGSWVSSRRRLTAREHASAESKA